MVGARFQKPPPVKPTAQEYTSVGGWGKKLTTRQAVALAADVARGMSREAAARKYNISARTVRRMLNDDGVRKGYPLKPCGTEAAYQRHLRNKEIACDDCLAAHRAKIQSDKRKKVG